MAGLSDDAVGPDAGQSLLVAGAPLDQARAAMLMFHGRGATAEDILTFTDDLARSEFAYLAPQAADHSWYPNGFLTPLAGNEPSLSSALAVVEAALARITAARILPERTVFLGFSQGACLMLEFVARHARRYGGVIGWSGGLIGPDDTPRDYAGSLVGTPVFLGCSDRDPHIPRERVALTADTLRRLGGDVTMRLYAGMGHMVNQDEIAFTRGMMATLFG